MEGMTRTSGFTLLEVIIVAAVIGVVASMVIPGFQNAKKAANESGCIGTMRSLMSATETYTLRYGSYPVQMQDLADVDIIEFGHTGQPANDALGRGRDQQFRQALVALQTLG